MRTSAELLQAFPLPQRGTIVVIGKESSGKSRLVSSLTGQQAYSCNFRGTTVSCEVFVGDENEFIDTPGILLQSDALTTSMALQKVDESDRVLLVLKATQLNEDLKELLPLVKGKTAAGVVTFWDKVPDDEANRRALEEIGRQLRIPLIPVDARHLNDRDRRIINRSLDTAVPASANVPTVRIPWRVHPRHTLLENPYVGWMFALALLLVPAILAVYSANHLADWLDPSIEAATQKLTVAMAAIPSPLNDALIGRYGLLTMGPLLFVWAVPTVLLYALVVGSYKASGLLDRVTVALHPAMRRIGMTGRDLVRVVMGFGCNVPAVINSRCCSSATRNTTISAIAFGSACSYQFGATLAVFAAVSRPSLVMPYLIYLVATTIVHSRLVAGNTGKTPFLILSMDKPTFLEWPRPRAIWAEARVTIVHFFRRAMPIFVGITALASLLDWIGLINVIANAVRPVMRLFDLPPEAALGIVFSSIRKDAILLFTRDTGFSQLRSGQILTAVYLAGVLLPCLVTAVTIAREKSIGFALKLMARQAGAAIFFAALLAWSTRLIHY